MRPPTPEERAALAELLRRMEAIQLWLSSSEEPDIVAKAIPWLRDVVQGSDGALVAKFLEAEQAMVRSLLLIAGRYCEGPDEAKRCLDKLPPASVESARERLRAEEEAGRQRERATAEMLRASWMAHWESR